MPTAIALTATYGLPVILVAAAVVWWRSPRDDKVTMATALLLGVLIGAGLLLASAMAWNDPRPFVVDGIPPLLPHAADNGFPSDHTTASALVAGVVLCFQRRAGIALLALATAVGAARVAAHVHHIPDVLAGLLIGVGAAMLAVVLARIAVGVGDRVHGAANPIR